MNNKFLIVLVILAIICFGIFFFQYTNNVTTVILMNETKIPENGTAVGFLMDSYGRGVENQTITYHQAGDAQDVFVNVTTGADGRFEIKNLKKHPESGANDYYGDISFDGYRQYKGCIYEYNLTVI